MFDLVNDPKELHNAVHDKKFQKKLKEMRAAMVEHLSERGDGFVKDGKLVVRKNTMLYSPNYPKSEE